MPPRWAPSYDAIFDPLARLFGCRVLHDNEVSTPGVERRGGMTWIADNSIEIGQPLGESSPVRRFLERFGGGMHSVAVQVADLDVALERAEGVGVHVASRIDEGLAFTLPGRHLRPADRVVQQAPGRRPALGRARAAVRG